MPVLFISHSSKDDSHASALEAWLRANGFTDIFVDHQSIAGGEKWRDALRAASGACRVVLCLVTESWLSSSECFHEFGTAWGMGKRIIPLFLLPPSTSLDAEAKPRLDRVCGEDQGIDLKPCINADGVVTIDADQNVATRLRAGLRAAGANSRVGLDPEAFATDVKLRPMPFPGLSSFGDDDADAALFYGRSREIAHTLEDLRSMRALNDQRPLVIHGASGAGKSSLLKAGIIPRLRREMPAWLPLRAFRPGADPLLNFAEAFADFCRFRSKRSSWRHPRPADGSLVKG
jgi:TIR domain